MTEVMMSVGLFVCYAVVVCVFVLLEFYKELKHGAGRECRSK